MFRRVHARMSWAALNVGAPRQAFQAQMVPAPRHANERPGVQMMVWSHGHYKCAVIVGRPSHHPTFHPLNWALLSFC
jgi:hypothetical protein